VLDERCPGRGVEGGFFFTHCDQYEPEDPTGTETLQVSDKYRTTNTGSATHLHLAIGGFGGWMFFINPFFSWSSSPWVPEGLRELLTAGLEGTSLRLLLRREFLVRVGDFCFSASGGFLGSPFRFGGQILYFALSVFALVGFSPRLVCWCRCSVPSNPAKSKILKCPRKLFKRQTQHGEKPNGGASGVSIDIMPLGVTVWCLVYPICGRLG